MKTSRTKFVTLFLAFGFAYMISTRLILNQMPASLYGSDFASEPQTAWQSSVSLLLSPVKLVLMGPLRPLFSWMLNQDGDPPPPMLALMYAVYWSILAVILHYFLSHMKHRQTADKQAGKST
jgi:hypothetical protein